MSYVTATMTETEPGKRKVSTSRRIHRRAAKACCGCRERKVRCDVTENGSPCTNCRLDWVECIVIERQRRKSTLNEKPRRKSHMEVENAQSTAPGTTSENNFLGLLGEAQGPLEIMSTSSSQESSVGIDLGGQVPHFLYQTHGTRDSSDCRYRHGLAPTSLAVDKSMLLSNTTVQLQQLLAPKFGNICSSSGLVPDYIRPPPIWLLEEDIDYLVNKGALMIPGTSLRNELLKSYVHHVHPYLPLLDLEEFLRTVLQNNSRNRISLLLFQAVMFAGTAFIDIQHLWAAGYQTRKIARRIFFQRARLLYDFDYELDRVSLVQSLLLMTYWYENPDNQKDTSYWMGVSLSLAHTIGLHRDPGNSRMDMRRQRMWKRIWWSVYTRDRLIALGMRRPMRVKDTEFDVPKLTLEDFELHAFSPEIIQMVGGSEILQNVNHQRDLALMFIEKAKLCACVSHVLSTQYSVLRHKLGGTMETTVLLVPKKLDAETFELRCCDQELDNWVANLPMKIQYAASGGTLHSEAEEVLHTHRAILRMVYLAISCALHRPQAFPAVPCPSTDAAIQEISRKKVRYAATEITNTAQDLHVKDLTRYCPTTGVTVLLPAAIIHLLDIKSSNLSVRKTSLKSFYQCIPILRYLQNIYASADFAMSFLEAAIRKVGIQLTVEPQDMQCSGSQNVSRSNVPFDALSSAHSLTMPADSLGQKTLDLSYPMAASASGRCTGNLFAPSPPSSDGCENGGSTNNLESCCHNHDAFEIPHMNSETSLNELIDLVYDAELTQHGFDTFINFDGGGNDCFAGETYGAAATGTAVDDMSDFDFNVET